MKKMICVAFCLTILLTALFGITAVSADTYFTPSITYSGARVSTSSHSAEAKAKYYSHVQVTLSVVYRTYGTGTSYSLHDGSSTSSNNPNQATSSVRAVVQAKNSKDYRQSSNATGRKWWTPVNQ